MAMKTFFRRKPRTAAEWIVRLNSDNITQGDYEALSRWIEKRPENRLQFEMAQATWGLSSQLVSSSRARTYLVDHVEPAAPHRWRFQLQMIGGAAAASAAIALLVVWLGLGTYSTGVGSSQVLSLDDGSTIWLNTNSRVRVKFDDHVRSVVLERGEAFFKVAHDASRPFIVDTSLRRIIVTGTQFDVRRNVSTVEVAVLEGHVRVEHATVSETVAAQKSVDVGGTTLLSAGQNAKFASTAAPVIERSAAVERKTAWRVGKIYLDNSTLGAAIEEINRYTKMKLVLADPDMKALSISGVFKTGDVDSVLFAVRELYKLEARQEGGEIILSQLRS